MTVGFFHDDDRRQLDRPGCSYGRFFVVKHGLKWEVVTYRPHTRQYHFLALPRFWRAVNACRVAQALHIERQHSYDEYRAEARP